MAIPKSFSDLNPLLAIDEATHFLVSKNADITAVIQLDLPEIFTLSDHDYQMVNEAFLRALKLLPAGYMVHKQDFFFEDTYHPDFDTQLIHDGGFVAHANEVHFADRPFLTHQCYIYITRPASPPMKRDSSRSSLFKRHLVPVAPRDPRVWDEFTELIDQFMAIFDGSSKGTIRLLTRDQLVGEQPMPGRPASRAPLSGLLQQYFSLSLTDTALHDLDMTSGLKVAGKYTHTFAVTELTDWPIEVVNQVRLESYSTDATTMPASTGSFFGVLMPFPHVFNQVILTEDADALGTQLVAEVKRHQSFSAWSAENQKAADDKMGFLGEQKAHSRRVVRAHFNILVFADDADTADSYRTACGAAIAKLGFRAKVAVYDAPTLYWSCIPGNIAEVGADNLATCFLEEAVALWNLETTYRDSFYCKSGIRLTDRFGRPVMVDLFFKPMEQGLIASRNFLVVGPSGTGKSFVMNNAIYYLLAQGAHVTLVDVGHSYKRLCQQMGGRYITYDKEQPLSFNPFYFKNLDPSEEIENALQNLLEALYYKVGETFTKSQETSVRDMVHTYYVHLRGIRDTAGPLIYPCFDSFYEFVEKIYPDIFAANRGREGKEFDLTNFLYVLRPFYRDGQYGYLLNSRTNIDLIEQPFVVYELDAIKDHPVLFPVTTIMIMNTYVRKLMEVKGPLKVLVIEEAWKALTNDNFATFLKWCSKTVRKHWGALGVVTQEVDDLVGNDIIKEAIINNSPIKLLLDQSNYAQRFDEVKATLSLTDKQANIILSVNKNIDPRRPAHREICLLLGEQTKVYGVEVSRQAYATFTTEKSEVLEIGNLSHYRYGGNMELAIRGWANGERYTLQPDERRRALLPA